MPLTSSSIAHIVLSGTRFIYKRDQNSVNVRLDYTGNNHFLVHSLL
ncbi:hypothetical protein NX007_02325, partial [Escherichia coli]|nr:hypothetical protein [Escherichia coli]